MSEVIRPKKIFAKASISAVALTIILFMLVNIAYVSAWQARQSKSLLIVG